MLELFKKQNPFTLFFVIIYGFAIRSSIFFIDFSKAYFDPKQPLSFLTDNACKLSPQNVSFHYVISTSILLLISIFINLYLKNNKIIDKLGYLPTLLFMLVSASYSSFLYMSNEFFAFIFFSISIIRLLQSLLVDETDIKVFDAAFFISIASLFYKPILPCILIVFIAIIILKNVQIKAIVFMLIGLLIPYFLLGVYMFLTDRLSQLAFHIIPELISQMNWYNHQDFLQISKTIFLGILSLLGFVKIQASLAKSIVNIRKYYSLLLIISLVYIPMFLINKQLTTTHFIFLLLPISYYLLNFLKDMKRIWISELIHVALFVLIYFSNINN
ncbi:MAG: DUF6427 family protein [Bacteroidota bacterium]